MAKINDIVEHVPVKKEVTVADQWPLLSHFEKGMPYGNHMPKVDIIERDDEFYVRAELPGVSKKDIDISMTDNSVTIKGKTKQDKNEEEGHYYRCEILRGAYARTLTLPTQVNSEKTIATFKDGLLELKLPKLKYARHKNITFE